MMFRPVANALDAAVQRRLPSGLPICRIIALLAWIPLGPLIGCAPNVILKPPVEWPKEWRDRQLYHTPRALIYASNSAAAGEADRLTNHIASEYKLSAPIDESSEKGLIIVTDQGDAPISEDVEELLTLFIHGQAQIAGIDEPRKERVLQLRQKLQEEGEMIGPVLEIVLVIIPIAIADAAVSQSLELPADATPAVAWAGVLPTDALIRAKTGELTNLMLDKAAEREELPAGTRWLIQPMMPMIRGMLAKEVLKQRDAGFQNIVRQGDPNWIADRDARKSALAAWPIVSRPGKSIAAYENAYADIRIAADRLPDDALVLRVLAAAEYRTGRFEPAIATLNRVRDLDRHQVEESGALSLGDLTKELVPGSSDAVDHAVAQATIGRPSDLAFRTMAEHRLGRTDEAAKTFIQLRDLIDKHDKDAASERGYLIEAATLLGRSSELTTQPASP